MKLFKMYSMILFICFACLNPHFCNSQNKSYSKCNVLLQDYIFENNLHLNQSNNIQSSPDLIPCFIAITDDSAIELIKSKGVKISSKNGNILTTKIPANSILEIANIASVSRIEKAAKLEFHVDTTKVLIGADKLHNPVDINQDVLKGDNVLVGIIDTGIDFRHLDFRNPNDTTKSRIEYIWSQTFEFANKPVEYDYGTEYTKADIEKELLYNTGTYVEESDAEVGHGTHVAGIAAGNRGIAPNANIILVQLNLHSDAFLNTYAIDALNYIGKKADKMGLPVVINASFSLFVGVPHDGSDLFSQAINNFVSEKNGRIFCSSAGNAGEYKMHLGKTKLNNDSCWTYLNFYSFMDNYIYCNVPIIDSPNLQFAIEADSIDYNANKLVNIGRSKWTSFSEIIDADFYLIVPCFNKDNNNEIKAELYITGSNYNNNNSEFNIKLKSYIRDNSLYKIILRGTGNFHVWSSTSFIDINTSNLETDDNFVAPNNEYMIGNPACAEKVITVGSYVNRYSYTNTSNITLPDISLRTTPGKLSSFSSVGSSTDGRIKPDIVAPGQYVVSCKASDNLVDSKYLIDDGTYIAKSGTSMSSPAVAGGIALLLQYDPNLNYDGLIKLIRNNAIQDEQTAEFGSLPNSHWGWGKFNVYKIIENYYSNIINEETIKNNFNCYPNPAYSKINFHISNDKSDLGKIKITNLYGLTELEQDINIDNGDNHINIDINNLQTGMYFINLTIGNKNYNGKIIKK